MTNSTELEHLADFERFSSENQSRNRKILAAIGGVAVVGIVVAGVLVIKDKFFGPDPEQTLGITTEPVVCTEASDENASYSIPIIAEGQVATLSTSTDSIGELVDITVSNGNLGVENLRNDAAQRVVRTGEEEVIEIFDPRGDGPEDDQSLMRIWSDGDPLQLLFSVPCE